MPFNKKAPGAAVAGTCTTQYLRTRAEEARTLADQMKDDELRRDMMDVANTYDELADHTDKLRSGGKHQPLHRLRQ
jgi:hypothetical protein